MQAKIILNPETGTGQLFYKENYICEVKFPNRMREAINTKIKEKWGDFEVRPKPNKPIRFRWPVESGEIRSGYGLSNNN